MAALENQLLTKLTRKPLEHQQQSLPSPGIQNTSRQRQGEIKYKKKLCEKCSENYPRIRCEEFEPIKVPYNPLIKHLNIFIHSIAKK